MKHILSTLVVIILVSTCSFAQLDSMMALLDKGTPKSAKNQYATATFKSTRLINGMTIENLGHGVLDFRICHRFGQVSQGAYNFYGIDDATTLLSLDYGITPWLMAGIGHSVLDKEYDGFIKAKLLRQRKEGMPITVSYALAASEQATPAPQLPAGDTWKFTNRLYFTHQLLIGRKFSEAVSVQLVPTLVHYNLVDSNKFSNNTIALGIGGRVKITKRFAITTEYYYRLNNTGLLNYGQKTYNSFSLGAELETGGHVFQLMVTNSPALTERLFIGQTTDTWSKDQLHIGFNISRVFTVVKPKEFRGKGNDKW